MLRDKTKDDLIKIAATIRKDMRSLGSVIAPLAKGTGNLVKGTVDNLNRSYYDKQIATAEMWAKEQADWQKRAWYESATILYEDIAVELHTAICAVAEDMGVKKVADPKDITLSPKKSPVNPWYFSYEIKKSPSNIRQSESCHVSAQRATKVLQRELEKRFTGKESTISYPIRIELSDSDYCFSIKVVSD